MKRTFFYSALLICIVSFIGSCKKHSGEDLPARGTFEVDIDLQSSFDGDTVQVFMDGQEILNKLETTDYSLGLAGGTSVVKNAGNHEIKVVINHRIIEAESFTLRDALFIGVGYNRQSGVISFLYSGKRFLYQ